MARRREAVRSSVARDGVGCPLRLLAPCGATPNRIAGTVLALEPRSSAELGRSRRGGLPASLRSLPAGPLRTGLQEPAVALEPRSSAELGRSRRGGLPASLRSLPAGPLRTGLQEPAVALEPRSSAELGRSRRGGLPASLARSLRGHSEPDCRNRPRSGAAKLSGARPLATGWAARFASRAPCGATPNRTAGTVLALEPRSSAELGRSRRGRLSASLRSLRAGARPVDRS